MARHDTKLIARNTIILYIRMVVVMLVALYTSRVVLQALGVSDYGIYNVTGGVVGLFAFLRSSMEKATQRFLNYEMGCQGGRLNDIFCTSLTIHIFIVIVVFILSETLGLWFFNNYLDIPHERIEAANWVYHCMVVSLCFTILSIPYSACIVAHEKMTFYAVVSVVDAFLKLAIALSLAFGKSDRLILYGALMMLVSVADIFMCYFYCRRFPETKFHMSFDKSLYKEVFSYVSWTLLGQMAIMGVNQGNGILVNMFHSVTANAAMSIGSQVNNAVAGLTSSFQTAYIPQMTESLAAKDHEFVRSLAFTTSKLSYLLLFAISVPIVFNMDALLSIWLGIVPEYAAIFCVLYLCNGMLNALSSPLHYCVMSSGRIRNFQIATALVYLSDLFILYLLFLQGLPPSTAMYVKIAIMVMILFVRLFYAHRVVPAISLLSYSRFVLLPLTAITVVTLVPSVLIFQHVDDIPSAVVATIVASLIVVASTLLFGLNKKERDHLLKMIIKKRSA